MRHDPEPAQLADLARRIDALAGQGHHLTAARLCDEIDGIRHSARIVHLDSVEELAGSLETVLSLNGLGWVVLSYLDRMRDAVGERLSRVSSPAPVSVLRG